MVAYGRQVEISESQKNGSGNVGKDKKEDRKMILLIEKNLSLKTAKPGQGVLGIGGGGRDFVDLCDLLKHWND